MKNSVSALVPVLDEAVRDGIVLGNPAKDGARRRTMRIDTGNGVGARRATWRYRTSQRLTC